jgi:hypothetical protein
VALSTWRVLVRSLLGLLLLTAAGLKAHGLAVDPVARMGFFSLAEIQLAIILFEVFLGLWLLSGKRAIGSWVISTMTFAVFAAISFYQGWIGQSSCGCAGLVSLSPWWAFGFDVLIVATLIIVRPKLGIVPQEPCHYLSMTLPQMVRVMVGTSIVMVLVLMGLAQLTFGSLRGTIAYFRGERVSVEPFVVDVGEGERGESRDVELTAHELDGRGDPSRWWHV